jgi:uncharacterized protein involved in response to NO
MRSPVLLKSLGYLVSIISVMLLGAVAWNMAVKDDTLRLCLIGGMATSILGMALRWASFLRDQHKDGKI